MRLPEPISAGLLPGAAGGAAGGLVFGAAMLDLGSLPSVASIVRVESEAAGFAVNMAIAATVGSGLGLLVWHQRPGLGETLLWGMAYGTLWWFIGTLTLHPLILGDGVRWDAESAQAGLPALLGHILFGATAGLTIVLARLGSVYRQQMARTSLWALVRGGLAGVLAVWMAGAVLAAQGQLHLFVAATPDDARALVWLMTVLVGLLAGIVFALLYPRPTESAGAGLIRGAMYGFLWWVVAPLSVLPALEGSELPWHLEEVREVFQTLPAYLLFGAAMSVFYQWLGVLARLLFSDVVAGADQEGIGTQGLLALARGLVAGFVGGLVFTGIMVKTGALGDVAGLAGMSSPVSGFVVHLVLANIVGASYGLLFRGQSYELNISFPHTETLTDTDLRELTSFADNLVPHVLRRSGALIYAPDLAKRIDAEESIDSGSAEEVEIRAAAVHAVELCVESLRKAGVSMTAHRLDYILWSRGQTPAIKAHPRHRTRSVYY